MHACYYGHENFVRQLIKSGVNVNRADEEGDTPLIMACEKGYKNIIQILIENGADINKSNKKGKTPLMISKKHGIKFMTNILNLFSEKAKLQRKCK